jgi:hypothetical protein
MLGWDLGPVSLDDLRAKGLAGSRRVTNPTIRFSWARRGVAARSPMAGSELPCVRTQLVLGAHE